MSSYEELEKRLNAAFEANTTANWAKYIQQRQATEEYIAQQEKKLAMYEAISQQTAYDDRQLYAGLQAQAIQQSTLLSGGAVVKPSSACRHDDWLIIGTERPGDATCQTCGAKVDLTTALRTVRNELDRRISQIENVLSWLDTLKPSVLEPTAPAGSRVIELED